MASGDNDALSAALAQFNEGLKIQEAEAQAARAVEKAERKKQQAAADLKKVQGDPNASADDKSAAESAYREAVDEWNRRRSGDPDAEPASESDATPDADAPSESDATPDESAAGDDTSPDND